jgi:hypothetical protein
MDWFPKVYDYRTGYSSPSLIRGADRFVVAVVQSNVEKEYANEALMSPDEMDVITGRFVDVGEAELVGSQKNTIAECRAEQSSSFDQRDMAINAVG